MTAKNDARAREMESKTNNVRRINLHIRYESDESDETSINSME